MNAVLCCILFDGALVVSCRRAINEKADVLMGEVEPVMKRQKKYIEELKSKIGDVERAVEERIDAMSKALREQIDVAVGSR